MKQYKVEIKGKTPYMQHRMDDISLDEWEKSRGRIIDRPEVAHSDLVRATYHSYIDEKGNHYMPADHLQMCLIGAGAFMKAKVGNARKSMKNIVAAMFEVTPEKIELPVFSSIDKRSAVNINVKARVMVVRPKWDEWSVKFLLNVDNDTITQETVKELIEYGGSYVGIGFQFIHNQT